MDLGSLFDSAKAAATTGMNDLLKQGASAGLGYLEGQAVAVIQADQQQHEADFAATTTEILNRPTTAGSFGAYLSNIVQAPALKEYGPYLIAGVAVVIGITLFMKGK